MWLYARIVTFAEYKYRFNYIMSTPSLNMHTYSFEEIDNMLLEAEEDYAAGRYKTNDELFGHKHSVK